MKVTPLNERHIMLWFRTKCLPYIMEGQGRYVNGHRFCHHVAIALGKAGIDVDVSCTDRQLGGRPLPFRRCAAFPLSGCSISHVTLEGGNLIVGCPVGAAVSSTFPCEAAASPTHDLIALNVIAQRLASPKILT